MEQLSFRLEGIVKTRNDQNEDFEGPLSLILQLLSRNRAEIRDIRISDITEQYIAYLEMMQRMDLEVASEFVRMAAHLVYIKTRTLLARDDEEVDEMEQLISSLEDLKRREEYRRLKAACELLRPLEGSRLGCYTKPQEYLEPASGYRYSHTVDELVRALHNAYGKQQMDGAIAAPIVRIPMPILYPTGKKSAHIVKLLMERGILRLAELFADNRSRSEVVATFLAVLELCRAGTLNLVGEGEECSVTYTGHIEDYVSEFDEAASSEEN